MGALTTAVVLIGLLPGLQPPPCPLEPLPAETLEAGDAAVARYLEMRRLQFTPDLMGYRDGPALGPPSAKERRAIREALRYRRTFGLNESRLLIRRLLRDRSPAVRRSAGEEGTPLAAPERSDMRFRIRVQNGVSPVGRYLDRCAGRVSGGLYLDQDAPGGLRVVASVVVDKTRHLEALSTRYRLRGLLRVRRVRFTERRLRSVSERLSDDFDEVEALHSTTLSIRHNRVFVGLKNGSRRDRRLLRDRYGAVLRFWAVP